MSNHVLIIDEKDNVAMALHPIVKGEEISCRDWRVKVLEDIPAGHKVATNVIHKGEDIVKYGSSAGHASADIPQGAWVHVHNMETNLSGLTSYSYSECKAAILPARHDSFMGYRRPDGRVGTRNELWIIPTVACVNHTAEMIAAEAARRFPGLCDGIFAVPHDSGCSQLDEGADISHAMINGIILHPNAGGALLVSLGCENGNLDTILPTLGDYNRARIRSMVTQEVAGDEVEYGVSLVKGILDAMSGDRREEVPASELVIGFKCGGSDAFSGITANPLVGTIADKVAQNGGSGILTEVSEMFGAEQSLMDRADCRETYDKIVRMVNSFKKYYMDSGLPIYENPSPGNKAGGITTDEEKSLGNVRKSGCTPITDVLWYGQQVTRRGINLLEGPGNDSVSITNLLSSGATMLLFTTGRGNPLATMVPTVKVSSNTRLAQRKPDWIDFDAGQMLDGVSLEEASERLWRKFLDIASGRVQSKGEEKGYRAVMIFKKGVLL